MREGELEKKKWCSPHGSPTHSDEECKIQLDEKGRQAAANTAVATTVVDGSDDSTDGGKTTWNLVEWAMSPNRWRVVQIVQTPRTLTLAIGGVWTMVPQAIRRSGQDVELVHVLGELS